MTYPLSDTEHLITVSELAQGSEAWKEWRRDKIGASDIPILMGESDFDTPLGLYRKKKKLDPDTVSNAAMERGLEVESKIRGLYFFEKGIEVVPSIFVHPEFPWAIASVDGDNEESGVVLEAKCVGKEKHAEAKAGKVPERYYGQCQWILFCSGRREVHYCSLDQETEKDLVILTVLPDYAYWTRMFDVAAKFQQCLETNTPPPHTAKDFMDLEDDSSKRAFAQWREAKFMVMQLEDILKELQTKLKQEEIRLETARAEIQSITKSVHPKIRCEGVKAFTVNRKSGPTIQIGLDE